MPRGSAAYWSWLFAAERAKPVLLGIQALTAEWRALTDPATEASVAEVKLLWWRGEVARLAGDRSAGGPVHPIVRYLAALPGAEARDFAPLAAAVDAAGSQVAGVPLETAADLEPHADALIGTPLRVAALLSGGSDGPALRSCTQALACGMYLARALADYRRETGRGRIPFAVADLLAAGIGNDDLGSAVAPAPLAAYFATLRQRAADLFERAAGALPQAERPALRHLAVLAALGRRHLNHPRGPARTDLRAADLYNAWSAARRAASGR